MRCLIKTIESVMHDDGNVNSGFIRRGLYGLSTVYGKVMSIRNLGYSKGILKTYTLPCVVISIGNITVGGTGKTPVTILLATIVKKLGYQVVIVSRGYGGKLSDAGGIVSNGKEILLTPEDSGDEPWLMADSLSDVPVIIGKSRYEAGLEAIRRFDPDVILLDDAFQHRKLNRDLDIVLMDSRFPFGNGKIIPRGTLREPAANISRADLILLTRSDYLKDPDSRFRKSCLEMGVSDSVKATPVYKTIHKTKIVKLVEAGTGHVSAADNDSVDGKSVFVFSGIAKNTDFRAALVSIGVTVKGYLEFKDHHMYSTSDVRKVTEEFLASGSDCLITTAKDFVKLPPEIKYPADLFVADAGIFFSDSENSFLQMIENAICNNRKQIV